MKALRLSLAFIFTLVLAGCNDEITFELNEVFKLGFEETAVNKASDISITFDSLVSDSRCPIGATCIWEGEATVALTVSHDGYDDPIELTLGQPPATYTFGTTGQFTLSLSAINPYPDLLMKPISQDDLSIELKVTEDGPTFCTEEYAPVCGYRPIVCVTTPCSPYQTYSNSCYAGLANAEIVFEGECGDISNQTPPTEDPTAACIMIYDPVCGIKETTISQ